jgi:hypothetical protein
VLTNLCYDDPLASLCGTAQAEPSAFSGRKTAGTAGETKRS